MTDQIHHSPFYAARQAIRRHATGGNVLILATILALVIANIPAINSYYFNFWNQEVRLQIGGFNLFSHAGHPMTVLEFINDALMAIFFFSIGLEIKREILVGIEGGYDDNATDIIDNSEGGEEYLEREGNTGAKHGKHSEGEGDIGSHGYGGSA